MGIGILTGRHLAMAFAHALIEAQHRVDEDVKANPMNARVRFANPEDTTYLFDTESTPCSPWGGPGRIGKGQRKASRGDRWKGPQGSRRGW